MGNMCVEIEHNTCNITTDHCVIDRSSFQEFSQRYADINDIGTASYCLTCVDKTTRTDRTLIDDLKELILVVTSFLTSTVIMSTLLRKL
jgi:hypothetical protein